MFNAIERPRVIAAHLAQMDKDEIFAQVVVRMITKQVCVHNISAITCLFSYS